MHYITEIVSNIFKRIEHPEPISMMQSFRPIDNAPLIVNADELHVLLDRSDCATVPTSLNPPSYKVLRFLLRLNGELVFAAEGYPTAHVPAHFQMTNQRALEAQCITAGNVYFDKDNRLCAIDHKSGDFRPSFDSLQFALNAIIAAKITLGERLEIRQLQSTGASGFMHWIRTCPAPIKIVNPQQTITEPCSFFTYDFAKQIKRLEHGANSKNPYWMNSSKKLKAITDSLKDLPKNIDAHQLKALVKDPSTDLYKALNMRRLSPITFLGQLGFNNAKSLQAVQARVEEQSFVIASA